MADRRGAGGTAGAGGSERQAAAAPREPRARAARAARRTGGVPAAATFTPNIRLNDDTGNGRQTEVALAAGPNGLVLAGWMDERSTRVCAFSFSTDGGLTWSKNVSIPNSDGHVRRRSRRWRSTAAARCTPSARST